MRNLIDAIETIVRQESRAVVDPSFSSNRANASGESLENYLKDAFADSFGLSKTGRDQKRSEIFSYLGNNSNPPDAILRGSYAIEVKKIESSSSDLALNSSYPKDKLYATDKSISKACRKCEKWDAKEMLYAVGVVGKNDKILHSLFFVFGTDYCADKEVYEKVKNIVKDAVNEIKSLDLAETEELGRVIKVDPLEITYMRVRGMWHVKNPMVHFKDYYSVPKETGFYLACIIDEAKLTEMGNSDILDSLEKEFETFTIKDIKIANPNNPAVLKNAKFILYYS